MCQPILSQRPKAHYKPSDPNFFISHTHPSFEFCRSSSAYYTTHVCQPILSQRPKTHYKLQIRTFSSHTHPCFELCRNSLPCYTTHVSQPILYQRPKIQHKRLMTQFCKPILIQPPKIHLSKFQCSPYRASKMSSLARRHDRMKTRAQPSGQKWSSVNFSG